MCQLLLFTYLNPALHYGFAMLAQDAKAAGIDGVLLTDLSVEEAAPYMQPLRDADSTPSSLAAPTSTDRRLKLVAEFSTGFCLPGSRTGVTGEQVALSESLGTLIENTRRDAAPLAAGFGISTPEQAKTVARMADGVVVGSAIVRQIETDLSGLESMVRALSSSMTRE
jgi:tryptophan synthase alpha chain